MHDYTFRSIYKIASEAMVYTIDRSTAISNRGIEAVMILYATTCRDEVRILKYNYSISKKCNIANMYAYIYY